jgi:hypothetical protein
LITGVVPVLVIDPLEVIDVDHDHRNGRVTVGGLDRKVAVETTTDADLLVA